MTDYSYLCGLWINGTSLSEFDDGWTVTQYNMQLKRIWQNPSEVKYQYFHFELFFKIHNFNQWWPSFKVNIKNLLYRGKTLFRESSFMLMLNNWVILIVLNGWLLKYFFIQNYLNNEWKQYNYKFTVSSNLQLYEAHMVFHQQVVLLSVIWTNFRNYRFVNFLHLCNWLGLQSDLIRLPLKMCVCVQAGKKIP